MAETELDSMSAETRPRLGRTQPNSGGFGLGHYGLQCEICTLCDGHPDDPSGGEKIRDLGPDPTERGGMGGVKDAR